MFVSEVVKKLILLNILVYFVINAVLPWLEPHLVMHYPFDPPPLAPEMQAQLAEFERMRSKVNGIFQPVQLVTYMFMHANLNHLASNMFGLLMFGSLVELRMGRERFLIYYLLTGFGALALHIGFQWYDIHLNPNLNEFEKYFTSQQGILGASGAVFGVSAALGMLLPNARFQSFFIPIPYPAWLMVLAYVCFETYLAIYSKQPGIAHWAHVGGALFGAIIIIWWKMTKRL